MLRNASSWSRLKLNVQIQLALYEQDWSGTCLISFVYILLLIEISFFNKKKCFPFIPRALQHRFWVFLEYPKSVSVWGNNYTLCYKCAETQPNSFLYVFTVVNLTTSPIMTIRMWSAPSAIIFRPLLLSVTLFNVFLLPW